MGYKAQTTLNEKDSLQDVLNIEKQLVKMYGTAMTESNSQKFRSLIKTNFQGVSADQYEVYQQMSKHNYYEVMPADKAVIDQQKQTFKEVLPTLKN